ncbi:hypothetical protein GX586_03775 [bacterium]|nr:hypothetical protein [bacterium]
MAACIAGAVQAFATEPLMVEALAWPHELHTWESNRTRTVTCLEGYTPRTNAPRLDAYGGDPSRTASARGFFHTVKTGGRWWLVDPAGNLFINVGLSGVSPSRGSGTTRAAFARLFGSEQAWADAARGLLTRNGFNGTGAWSADAALAATSNRLAYTPIWNFMSAYGKRRGGTHQQPGHTGYPHDAIFVFDPAFEAFAGEHAKQLAAHKDDPWLLGHFSDNELPFKRNTIDNFLALDTNEHGYAAARHWLARRHGTDAAPDTITDEDRCAFLECVADRYFSIVSKAIRRHDPNHLYLGCRFYSDEKTIPAVFRAAGRHADVVSVNLYLQWTPDASWLANWERWSGKPVLITEFYAKGVDSGMANESGAGFLVKTQRDRGLFYQNFTLGLLASKVCVGWHLFKYADNDPENLSADPSNRNSNKGIVTACYDVHTPYVDELRALNWNVYDVITHLDRAAPGAAAGDPPAAH